MTAVTPVTTIVTIVAMTAADVDTTMSTTDVVAPPTGSHTLEEHYRELGGSS